MREDQITRLEALKLAVGQTLLINQRHVTNCLTVAAQFEDFINNGKKPEEKE